MQGTLAPFLVVLLLLVPSSAGGAPGDLDPSFSTDGLAYATFGAGTDERYYAAGGTVRSAALTSDGRLVVLADYGYGDGSCHAVSVNFCTPEPYGAALARFNPDGSLDPSFSEDGQLELGTPQRPSANADEVAIQPDGKVVLLRRGGFSAIRLNEDGSLDGSFGQGGFATHDLTAGYEVAHSLDLLDDGRIVLGGVLDPATHDYKPAIAVLRTDGSLDEGFSDDGWRAEDLGRRVDYLGLQDVEALPDGRIVAMTTVTEPLPYRTGLLRYQPDGRLDSSFGTDGVSIIDQPGFSLPEEIAVDPLGRILISARTSIGSGSRQADVVLRTTPNGELDMSFGNRGRVMLRKARLRRDGRGYLDGLPAQIAADAEARPVVAADWRGLIVRRLTASGVRDTTFSHDGSTVNYPGGPPAVGDLLLTGTAITVVGSAYLDGELNTPLAARYRLDTGPADADADGTVDRRDECPFVHGGCPVLPRRVSLELKRESGRPVLIGNVLAKVRACSYDLGTEVFARRKGPDRKLYEVTSTFYGFTVPRLPKRGPFYAQAPERTLEYGRCPRARSALVKRRSS